MRCRSSFAVWASALAVAFAVFAAPPARAAGEGQRLAQAGSTGGVVGKRGKSVSDSDATTKPAKPEAMEKPAPPPNARAAPLPRPAPVRRGGNVSIAGRWLIQARCGGRLFEVAADLSQTSATSFTGTALGITTGGRTRIVAGRLDGDAFSWVRRARVAEMRARGRISGDRIEGSERGPLGNCRFTGTRQ